MKLIKTISKSNDGVSDWAAWVNDGDPVWYVIMSHGEDKSIPKDAGFLFHGKKDPVSGVWKGKKLWWTSDFDKAAMLADYAIGDTASELSQRKIFLSTSIDSSRAENSDKNFPCPENLAYKPFQKAGIDYMLNHLGY